MPTKANGLLYADYARAMKARERFGAKRVRVYRDGSVEYSFGDERDDKAPDASDETGSEPGLAPAPRQGYWRAPGSMGGRAGDVIRDLLQSGPASVPQMRAELLRCGYSQHSLGTVLDALKSEIERTERGVYALKLKLDW
jgi:hypothetical protein